LDKELLYFRGTGSYILAPPADARPSENDYVSRFYQKNLSMKP